MSFPKIAVIVSRFNSAITNGLLQTLMATLEAEDFDVEQIDQIFVPGAFEIPYMAQKMARRGVYQAIVTLGCVIKGETAHFEAISTAVAHGLQQVALEESIPVLFGVLTTYNEEQAIERIGKGGEVAHALLDLLSFEVTKTR